MALKTLEQERNMVASKHLSSGSVHGKTHGRWRRGALRLIRGWAGAVSQKKKENNNSKYKSQVEKDRGKKLKDTFKRLYLCGV